MKFKGLKAKFITGILVITPAFVSIFIIIFIFNKIDNIFSPLIVKFFQKYFFNVELPHFAITLLSLFFLFLFILLVGVIAENFIGKKLIKLIDRILSSTPLVKGIYVALKQLLDAFRLTNSQKFNKVVFVEYPKKEMWVIGFTTAPLCEELSDYFSKKNMINVFIPTTPNPTSGYLVVVERDSIVETNLSIEDAVKYVVSGGVIQPEKCKNEFKQS
ncbi:conserved hypothetical protein [Thermotomaculum hydrothermale]|uniref:Transporter n=1 Tax=Thermotomaculum hydrothermale TaxID=981385 RepID=A0A7R6SZ86_9BACT|nr:DUF502 domain-containing protein [Thermotomaculum hydrothermale]BBB32492.1 conserved hypothetical protein [Thermotomaculum hydrothermale]